MTEGEIKCLRKLQPGEWQESYSGGSTSLWSLHAAGLVRTRSIPDEQVAMDSPTVSLTNQKYDDDRREWLLTPEGEIARSQLPPEEILDPGTITSFQGVNRFLSNFWPADVVLDEEVYPSVEHAYQAAKTLDKRKRKDVLRMTPAQCKKFGKGLKIREDWDQVKLDIMYDLVRQKFQHSHLKTKLLETTGELREGNTWGDTFWGICRGQGENHLGKILMRVREELSKEVSG